MGDPRSVVQSLMAKFKFPLKEINEVWWIDRFDMVMAGYTYQRQRILLSVLRRRLKLVKAWTLLKRGVVHESKMNCNYSDRLDHPRAGDVLDVLEEVYNGTFIEYYRCEWKVVTLTFTHTSVMR